MFKNQVLTKYQVVSSERELARMIDSAEQELADLEDELETARDKYENFEIAGIDPTDAEQAEMDKLQKDIEEMEKEQKKLASHLESVRHTTVDDLKADRRFDEWKD